MNIHIHESQEFTLILQIAINLLTFEKKYQAY